MGIIMNLQNTSPLTLFFCGHEKCDPSHSFGPAVRPHYLLHFILNGQGTYYEAGNEHKLKAGDGFLITPGKTTYYIADYKDPWEYCWIGFDGYEAKNILLNCGLTETNLIIHVATQEIKDCFLKLNQIFDSNTGNTYTFISYLYQIFSYMLQNAKQNNPSKIDPYLDQALSYISNNYIYDIKINDLAQFIGIDRTYLYKIFKENKNVAPQQYLINYRLQAACSLLKETKLTVTEIAYSCGFKDAPSFNKHFKKRYYITPLEFRKITMVSCSR